MFGIKGSEPSPEPGSPRTLPRERDSAWAHPCRAPQPPAQHQPLSLAPCRQFILGKRLFILQGKRCWVLLKNSHEGPADSEGFSMHPDPVKSGFHGEAPTLPHRAKLLLCPQPGMPVPAPHPWLGCSQAGHSSILMPLEYQHQPRGSTHGT